MGPCGPLRISAITDKQQGAGWSLSSCCVGSHATISKVGCLWFLVNKCYWPTVRCSYPTSSKPWYTTQQPVMAVGCWYIHSFMQSAFLLICSGQPLGMLPCILLALHQIPTVPLHSALCHISSPTFTLVHFCRFPFALYFFRLAFHTLSHHF
jgi:hypothetical protein